MQQPLRIFFLFYPFQGFYFVPESKGNRVICSGHLQSRPEKQRRVKALLKKKVENDDRRCQEEVWEDNQDAFSTSLSLGKTPAMEFHLNPSFPSPCFPFLTSFNLNFNVLKCLDFLLSYDMKWSFSWWHVM